MKTNYLLVILIFAGIMSCHSQEIKNEKDLQGKKKPKEEVTVNRKYDKNGNLIEFDSTYTSYYSSFMDDTLLADSVLQNFNRYFNFHLSHITSPNFMVSDSTFMHGFLQDDFFEEKFLRQDEQMLRMMREIDSMKNEFFRMHQQSIEELKL